MTKMQRHFISLRVTLLFLAISLPGCSYELFDPKGPVAEQQMWLIIFSAAIMLIVVIPVMVMGAWFPYRYRANRRNAEYKPNWEHSNRIEFVVWAVPIVIILVLGAITFITSHSLDPRQPIASENPQKVIQVVAMDWKWLFIYPDEQIATVNEIAIPVDTPIQFLVTSDTVMNSFFIPQLGTQIYAMSGMENRLHLMATEAGEYEGFSANYSGFGFSGMKFTAIARDEEGYADWIATVKASGGTLDSSELDALRVKSRDVQPLYYSEVDSNLFSEIITRFTGVQHGD